jgi:TldD protein
MSDVREPASSLPFFEAQFGLDERRLGSVLDTALARPVDYADLYFEYTIADSVSLEEGIVRSGSRHLEQGVGVRAVSGERQGYAHSDDVAVESVQLAATTARAIARGEPQDRSVAIHPCIRWRAPRPTYRWPGRFVCSRRSTRTRGRAIRASPG